MHRSIQTALSRRNVLKGAAVVSVAATPIPASAKPAGTSKRIGELFHDWQRAWLAHGIACEAKETEENNRIADEYCDISHSAFQALLREPALCLRDIAAKVHAFRIHLDGSYPEKRALGRIWQDIERLAVVGEA